MSTPESDVGAEVTTVDTALDVGEVSLEEQAPSPTNAAAIASPTVRVPRLRRWLNGGVQRPWREPLPPLRPDSFD